MTLTDLESNRYKGKNVKDLERRQRILAAVFNRSICIGFLERLDLNKGLKLMKQ